MAANKQPIFSRTPDIQLSIWTNSSTANVKSDGTGTIGTDMLLGFAADVTEGGYLDRSRFSPSASAASTATGATMLRVYLSTKTSGSTTRTDTFLWQEVALSAQTVDTAGTTPSNYVEVNFGFAIPAGMTVLWSMHAVASANTSWQAVAIGGKY